MNTTNEASSEPVAGPVERPVRPTAGMRAYAAWHGMTLEHVRDEWDSVPKADKIRAKWEAVGAAVEAAERERCAKKAAPEHIPFSDDEWRVRCEVRDSILDA